MSCPGPPADVVPPNLMPEDAMHWVDCCIPFLIPPNFSHVVPYFLLLVLSTKQYFIHILYVSPRSYPSRLPSILLRWVLGE